VLTSTTTGTVPFCSGFALRQGDIPSGQTLAASGATAQAIIKNTWPDGSAKFAVVSGVANVVAGSPLVVSLSASGSAAAGTALSTTELRNTGITASIGCGAFGTASWSDADWASPYSAWISGPQMSSWIYRKPVGSDAHLVAWLEVRLFANGAVEVLPWIENGYLRVASPTNKSATYTFSLGGTQHFSAAIDLPNHCRTPLINGAALSYWLGTDPGVAARPDAAYLQSTRMVPTYAGNTPATAAVVTALPASYAPLQQGSMPSTMGTTGYHGSIGLLPEWDVLYLTSTAGGVLAALQRNAYSAGRYGIHFRDEATNRPLRFSQHSSLVVNGSSGVTGTGSSSTNTYTALASGTSPSTYTNTHCPALGYFAYLLTGRYYHLETTQFQATLHYLKNGDSTRQFGAGILRSDSGANTTRGAAWSLRTLAQALAITPDGDVLQTELKASFEANVNYLHARYVAQPNNPFGWVTPYNDYTGTSDAIYFGATWQQDFYTAAIGMAATLGLPLGATPKQRLSEFFAWKAKSVIGRLGTTATTEFLYRDAAPYTIAIAPTNTPDFNTGTGPWYANWGACYDATYASASPGTRNDGPLRGSYFPEPTSYWGNMQPALAYAVDLAVPGARDAYNRMASASNWAQLNAGFDSSPTWGVRPRS